MQGKQTLNESLFTYNLSIDSFVPETHILRKINKIVDLSFIRELTKNKYCSDNGRPSIDPELFFRLMIIKYIYGIESERRLCEDAHSHMGYRWFCQLSMQDVVPHHSSLSKIRERLGEAVIEQFFDHIVSQCRQHGLVNGKRIITDGTLIQANASINSMTATDLRTQHTEILNKKDYRRNPDQKPIKRKLSNKTHLSSTDPDSTLAYKKGTVQSLKYKGHFSIDAQNGIILDPFISTGADHEAKHYLNRLDTIQEKYDMTIGEAVADRGYGTGTIISELCKRNIRPLIPLFHHSSGSAMPDGFRHDPTTNTIECPAGNRLEAVGKKDNYVRQRYIIRNGQCMDCKVECTANILKRTGHPRIIQRSQHQDYFDRINSQVNTAYFKSAARERFYKIEGVFSEAKRLHGFRNAQFRGRKKVQIQSFFTASILNIKKMIKLVGKQPKCVTSIHIFQQIFQIISITLHRMTPVFCH